MFLLIDNYDSFTYNLYALCLKCGVKVTVIKHDEWIDCEKFAGIIISPGPSDPSHAGRTLDYIKRYKAKIPILGICLGMQAIGQSENILVHKAKTVRHGKLEQIHIQTEHDSVLYQNMADNFQTVRYHSLSLKIDASSPHVTSIATSDGEIMSYEDRSQLLFGVQYHPESFLSEGGEQILRNFFGLAQQHFAQRKKEIIDLALTKLWGQVDLSFGEAKVLFDFMLDDQLTAVEIASILLALKAKGESVSELLAAVMAMDQRKKVFSKGGKSAIDTCGTGGSGHSGMNISTAVAIGLAAMGHSVVKHGNRAQSGRFGSADILEELGLAIASDIKEAEKSFSKHQFAFLFAPAYHPSLKKLVTIRREMRTPTIFNLLGPLVNPAECEFQIIGTPRFENAQKMAQVIAELKRHQRAIVYSSRDGHDEISSFAISDCLEIDGEGSIRPFAIDPHDFFTPFPMPKVTGAQSATVLFLKALEGRDENLMNLVALNGALGLKCLSAEFADLKVGFNTFKKILREGKAQLKLQELVKNSEHFVIKKN